jgi:YesN/AraC family two-component response regulator
MTTPKVLIADDVEDIRDLLSMFLEDEVDIVGEAEEGNEALELIDSLKPDMIFLDINMPGVTGLEILDRIKDKPEIFSVIVSGDGDFETIKIALEKGAKGFISKPIDENKVIDIVEKYKNGLTT